MYLSKVNCRATKINFIVSQNKLIKLYSSTKQNKIVVLHILNDTDTVDLAFISNIA